MKIAIVKLSAMGDIIHAMAALDFIKQHDGEIVIDWIVEEGFRGILENNPNIDNILTLNLKSIKQRKLNIFSQIKKALQYRKNNYDIVIDAQGLLKSAIVARLLGKNVVGFSKGSIREKIASFFYDIKVDIPYHENTILRNMNILSEPLGFKITTNMLLEKNAFLFFSKKADDVALKLINNKSKNALFVIGSTWESRNYPKEKFALLAEKLQINTLISWGNEEEKERALWIENNSKFAKALPKLNLDELKAIISKCDIIIGNDTGPTHMAWGLNAPSVTIFGPTPPNRILETKINKYIKSSSSVNHYKLDKNDFSIKTIKPSQIVTIAKQLLEQC